MLDIKSIRENPDRIKERLKLRGGDVWQCVDEVLDMDGKRRTAETEKQHLQSERNRTSKEIAELLKISTKTVDNHRHNICKKLNIYGSHSLLKFAFDHKSYL